MITNRERETCQGPCIIHELYIHIILVNLYLNNRRLTDIPSRFLELDYSYRVQFNTLQKL